MFKDYFKKNLYITEYQNVFLSIINKVPRLTFEFLAVLICLLIVNFFFKNSRNELLPILTLYGISLIRLIPSYAQISSSIMSIRFYKSSFDLICDELRLNESKQINEGNKINKSSLIYELDKKINMIQYINLVMMKKILLILTLFISHNYAYSNSRKYRIRKNNIG